MGRILVAWYRFASCDDDRGMGYLSEASGSNKCFFGLAVACGPKEWAALCGGNEDGLPERTQGHATHERWRRLAGKRWKASGQVSALFKGMQDESKEKVVVLHLNPQSEIL